MKIAFFPYKKIKTKIFFWITQNEVDAWSRKTNICFILAHGRSGTAFLANLLNKASGAHIVHEPVTEDFRAYTQAFNCPAKATRYFHEFRKKEIFLRTYSLPIETYGEVNSVLRRHAKAIQETLPNATLIHLVRDGRDVVRSMYSRKTMTLQDPVTQHIQPGENDPYWKTWGDMDRFARLCWYWRAENIYLRTTIRRTIQLEHIIRSYDYLSEYLLEPCHIMLPKRLWREEIGNPQNNTGRYQMAHWRDWTPEQKRAFSDICGEEMRKNGYNF